MEKQRDPFLKELMLMQKNQQEVEGYWGASLVMPLSEFLRIRVFAWVKTTHMCIEAMEREQAEEYNHGLVLTMVNTLSCANHARLHLEGMFAATYPNTFLSTTLRYPHIDTTNKPWDRTRFVFHFLKLVGKVADFADNVKDNSWSGGAGIIFDMMTLLIKESQEVGLFPTLVKEVFTAQEAYKILLQKRYAPPPLPPL